MFFNPYIYNGKPHCWNFDESDLNPWMTSEQEAHYGEPILMQYIGLKDESGKELYEGDIVYFRTPVNAYNAAIEKDEVNPAFVLHQIGKRDWFEYDFVKCGDAKIKLLGNIYENPELLQPS